MAIKAQVTRTNTGVIYPDAHVVIGSFVEQSKGLLCVSANVWQNKTDYLNKMPAIDSIRHIIKQADLVQAVDFRTSVYNHMMTQPEYTNPVADMNDDFPVVPVK